MTYDVQAYCFCWICEAMVKWKEPCHDVGVTNAHYSGMWVLAADAEAHEKAALEYVISDNLAYAEGFYNGEGAARKQAIRDCIDIVEKHDKYVHRLMDASDVLTDMSALLEGTEK